MPRRARLRLAHVPFHVVQRGHNRSACFRSDRDRALYLHELGTLSRALRVDVHAYVLMTNHVHLLATGAEPDGIPAPMKALGQRYVRHFNRSYSRTGALWEGRYHSSVVETEGYLLTCHRYVEANPVRAGMVSTPGEYRWSSFRANAFGEPDPVVSPHPVIAGLGRDADERQASYRALFETPLTSESLDDLRVATRGGHAIGSEPFKRSLEAALQRPVTRRRPGRRRK